MSEVRGSWSPSRLARAWIVVLSFLILVSFTLMMTEFAGQLAFYVPLYVVVVTVLVAGSFYLFRGIMLQDESNASGVSAHHE